MRFPRTVFEEVNRTRERRVDFVHILSLFLFSFFLCIRLGLPCTLRGTPSAGPINRSSSKSKAVSEEGRRGVMGKHDDLLGAIFPHQPCSVIVSDFPVLCPPCRNWELRSGNDVCFEVDGTRQACHSRPQTGEIFFVN